MAFWNFWHKQELKLDFPRVDIHTHVLPGIDDGSKDEGMTLEMMEAALKAQVVHINATAHHRNTLMPEPSEIEAAFRKTAALRDKNALPLSLSCSMETEFFPGAEEFFSACRVSLTGKAGKYALIEFTSDVNQQAAVAAVFQLSLSGFRPVVVHPERFYFVQRHPEAAGEMQSRGALIMPNATSFVGHYGQTAKETAEKILETGVADALSSDAHRPEYYEQYDAGCRCVAEKVGESKLIELTWKTPCRILGYEPASERDDFDPFI
jgi:protein-tyrosine phosphatase